MMQILQVFYQQAEGCRVVGCEDKESPFYEEGRELFFQLWEASEWRWPISVAVDNCLQNHGVDSTPKQRRSEWNLIEQFERIRRRRPVSLTEACPFDLDLD